MLEGETEIKDGRSHLYASTTSGSKYKYTSKCPILIPGSTSLPTEEHHSDQPDHHTPE